MLAVGHSMLAVDHSMLAVGHSMPAVGHSMPAVGHSMPAVVLSWTAVVLSMLASWAECSRTVRAQPGFAIRAARWPARGPRGAARPHTPPPCPVRRRASAAWWPRCPRRRPGRSRRGPSGSAGGAAPVPPHVVQGDLEQPPVLVARQGAHERGPRRTAVVELDGLAPRRGSSRRSSAPWRRPAGPRVDPGSCPGPRRRARSAPRRAGRPGTFLGTPARPCSGRPERATQGGRARWRAQCRSARGRA
jgi:hypothetical protein